MGRRQREEFRDFLERIGASERSIYPALARTAEFGEGHDRSLAFWYLGQFKYRRAIRRLVRIVEWVDGTDDAMRVPTIGGACDALGMIDDPRAHRALVSFYRTSTDEWTQAFAVDALGYEKDNADPGFLIHVLQGDDTPRIRYHAALAMMEQVSWNTFAPYEKAVVAALRDPVPCVRAAAIRALERTRKRRHAKHIRPLLDDASHCDYERQDVASVAREALEELGFPQA